MAGTNVNQDVVGGVDTHKDVHAAAALSVTGQLLGTALFPTTRAGLSQLLTWLTGHGALIRVGVEGTGSYGSGLMRHLRSVGISVVEVNRPNRQFRRQRGKSVTDGSQPSELALEAGAGGSAGAVVGWCSEAATGVRRAEPRVWQGVNVSRWPDDVANWSLRGAALRSRARSARSRARRPG
jgi:Transposase